MKTSCILLFICLIFISCESNDLTQNRINEIDNAFVNSNFNYSYLETLNIDKETNYYNCLNDIAVSMNDKRITGGLAVMYKETNTDTFFDTGLFFIYLSKVRRIGKLDSTEVYDHFLNKKLYSQYEFNLSEYYEAAYIKDEKNQNIWVRLGISMVLSDNRYYQDAIEYLYEAESINQDNNFLKELMVKNLLLQGDTINAKIYLNKIQENYTFNELDQNIRDIIK